MIIYAGMASEDYLADWIREVYKTSGMVFGYLLLSVLSAGMLLRLLNQSYFDLRAIRASEEKFRIALERSPNAVFISDPNGNFTYINERAAALVGYDKAELLSMGIIDLLCPDEAGSCMAAMSRVIDSHHVFLESALLHRSGHQVDVEVNGVLLCLENRKGVCNVPSK
jgi:PAS domain S-box-containing protein